MSLIATRDGLDASARRNGHAADARDGEPFARPKIGIARQKRHSTGDDDLGRDEAVNQHAHNQQIPDLVERGGDADEERTESERHDDAREADDVAGRVERHDNGIAC